MFTPLKVCPLVPHRLKEEKILKNAWKPVRAESGQRQRNLAPSGRSSASSRRKMIENTVLIFWTAPLSVTR
jgi:hypothetical protein